jgi:hypothetical protein
MSVYFRPNRNSDLFQTTESRKGSVLPNFGFNVYCYTNLVDRELYYCSSSYQCKHVISIIIEGIS